MPGQQSPAPARLVAGRRTAWLVALVPLLLAILAIGFVPEGEHEARATDSLPEGADSTLAVQLAERLPDDEGQVALVLWTGDGELARSDVDAVTEQASALLPSGQARGEQPQGPPLVVSDDGTAALAVVPVVSSSNTDNIDKVEELRDRLRADVPDGLDVQVTGPAAIQADIGQVFDGADLRLLLSTAAVVAILLILTYRSPVLWLVPLTVVGIADRFAAIAATNVL